MNHYRSIRKRAVSLLLAVILTLSLSCSAFAEIHLYATILPDSYESLQTVLTVNNQSFGLLLPAQGGTYYLLYWNDLPDILSQAFGFDLSGINTVEADEEFLTSLALRYGRIIISVAGLFNLSRKKMNYELSAFHSAPKCVVWTFTPSRRDWTKMLTKLFATAQSDANLAAFLPAEAISLISEGQNHIEEIADVLDGLSFQAATDDNNIYAVKISKREESICYQYPGGSSSECALVYERNRNLTTLVYAVCDFDPVAVSETPERVNSAEKLTEILSDLLQKLPDVIGSGTN